MDLLFLSIFYLRNYVEEECAEVRNAISSATLNRVAEEPHPSQCHPRVMFSGEHAHEGTETQYRVRANGL